MTESIFILLGIAIGAPGWTSHHRVGVDRASRRRSRLLLPGDRVWRA